MGKLAHRRAAGLAVLVLLLGLIPLVALAEVTEIIPDTFPKGPGKGGTCPDGQEGWSEHISDEDPQSGDWGEAEWLTKDDDYVLITVNEGYEVLVCTKGGDGRTIYLVTEGEDQIVSAPAGYGLSHWSYLVITLPPPPTEPTQPTTPALGAIVIEKVSNVGTGTFQFTSPQVGGFALTTTAMGEAGKVSQSFTGLVAGTYSVAETLPTPTSTPEEARSWTMTASCDNEDTPDSITLEAGETVTCTFVNTLTVVRGIQVTTTTTAPATTTTAAIAVSTLPFTGPGGDLMAVPVAMAVVAIGLIALLGATRPDEESIGR
jgi:hypothetical protein